MLPFIFIFCLSVISAIQSNSTNINTEIIQIPDAQLKNEKQPDFFSRVQYFYMKYQEPIRFILTQRSAIFTKIPGLSLSNHHTVPMLYRIQFQGTVNIAAIQAVSYVQILIDNQVLISNFLLPNSDRRFVVAADIGGEDVDYRGGSYFYSGSSKGASFSFYKSDLVLLPEGTHLIEVGVRGSVGDFQIWGGQLSVETTEYNTKEYVGLTFPIERK